MWVSRQGQARYDLECEATPCPGDLISGSIPPEHLGHFDIEEMWSVEGLARVQKSGLDGGGRGGPEQ